MKINRALGAIIMLIALKIFFAGSLNSFNDASISTFHTMQTAAEVADTHLKATISPH